MSGKLQGLSLIEMIESLYGMDKDRNTSRELEIQHHALKSSTGFLKALIIHEGKTKEITTLKEVWICDPNYHKIR